MGDQEPDLLAKLADWIARQESPHAAAAIGATFGVWLHGFQRGIVRGAVYTPNGMPLEPAEAIATLDHLWADFVLAVRDEAEERRAPLVDADVSGEQRERARLR